MSITNNHPKMCPFCPLMNLEPEEYLPIGSDFFGNIANIGGIPSCESCASVVAYSGTTERFVKAVSASCLAGFHQWLSHIIALAAHEVDVALSDVHEVSIVPALNEQYIVQIGNVKRDVWIGNLRDMGWAVTFVQEIEPC